MLELDCGEGHLCRLLSGHGYTVTGIDISPIAILWALKKNTQHSDVVNYICGDFSQEMFFSFDMIVDGNYLHCIPGEFRQSFLENFSICLTERGVFFVSSLCSQNSNVQIIHRNGLAYRYIPSVEGLKSELEQSGFIILALQVHPRSEYDHINLLVKRRPG